ncbi:MAG: hypothetical protein HC888_05015, partial [Candidatus Competibacteraceae bacterium]|nr:hypothetical protein [Candidatus Competibacteraceae bacterium]
MLIIDCDFCRQQFSQTKMASSDTIALKVHGENLRRSAEEEGWSTTECNSSHFARNVMKKFWKWKGCTINRAERLKLRVTADADSFDQSEQDKKRLQLKL